MIHTIIVDDEYIVRKGLRETIDWNRYGIEIIGEAESGRQVLSMIQSMPADLLLVDVTMPGLSGLELIRILHETAPDILCVVITCHASFSYAQCALREGAVDYLVKTELEDAQLEESLTRISRKITGILERRAQNALQEYAQKDAAQKLLQLLRRSVWFLDQQAFQDLAAVCGEIQTITQNLRRPLCALLAEERAVYRLPEEWFVPEWIDSLKTGNELLCLLEQLGKGAALYFLEAGYREEIVRSVLCAANDMAYIPHESLSQNALCKKYSISRSYFSRVFHDLFRTSFQDYIIWARIEAAKRLIQEHNTPLDELSVRVGLEDQKHFNRCFKELTGMTPTEYQRYTLNTNTKEI